MIKEPSVRERATSWVNGYDEAYDRLYDHMLNIHELGPRLDSTDISALCFLLESIKPKSQPVKSKRSDRQRAIDILKRKYPDWVFKPDEWSLDVFANKGEEEVRILFEQIQDDLLPEIGFKVTAREWKSIA